MQASIYMVFIQIGSHIFHLHEIYGLSSASNQSTVPAVNPTEHTYPPTAAAPAEDEPSSECLVCLSSPREVVLLPCRHLVACKECAINMVEFGAGGAIMHAEEPTTNSEPQPAEIAETPAVNETTTRWHYQRHLPHQALPHRYRPIQSKPHLHLLHKTHAASDAPRAGPAPFVVNVSD